MKISLKWLSEFFENENSFSKIMEKKQELRKELPKSGLEIGEVKKLSEGREQILVAQIVEFQKHPQADRLNVCQVSVGEGSPRLQIVCGAPRLKVGMKIPLAPVGAVLPGNFQIKEAEIRGVKSWGMLCSEKELGFAESSDGLMVLAESAPVGSSLVKALGLDDEIWDFELTPDRGDCFSHRGLAREFSRILGLKMRDLEIDPITSGEGQNEVSLISLENAAPEDCTHYGLQLFEGVQNAPSPDWLQRRLESVGIRTHHSVVDLTNAVMMEFGHPVHAFDADKVRGSKIRIRKAKIGEKLKTLDGIVRDLDPRDLVIADAEGPLALAGVMGGFDSAVTFQTQRVILECAHFSSDRVREMSKRHKLVSDSSQRFERGVNLFDRTEVVGRFTLGIKNLCRARRRGAFVETALPKYETQSINLDLRNFRNTTALETQAEELSKHFASVKIESTVRSPNVLKVDLPAHRFDLKREIDLIEEGARLIGYDKIPSRYPVQNQTTQSLTRPTYRMIQNLRRGLLEMGLSEVKPYAFVSENQLSESQVSRDECVEIANPLSEDWKFLRPSLYWGLLDVLKRQISLGVDRWGGFDWGHCFYPQAPVEGQEYSTRVRESLHCSWTLMGLRHREHWSLDKKQADRKAGVDFFDAKGIFEKLSEVLSVAQDPRWRAFRLVPLSKANKAEIPSWIPLMDLHPGRSALIEIPSDRGFITRGYVGELHPQFKGTRLNLATDFDTGVAMGEVEILEDLLAELTSPSQKLRPQTPSLTPSRKFPWVRRDLAWVLSSEVNAGDVLNHFRKLPLKELMEIECVDLYPLSETQKSLAFRFTLQGVENTLSEIEISKIMNQIQDEARKKFSAELR